jgi:hypothetical protein
MAFVAPALVAAFAARSWRPVLSIEAFVCALGVAAYGFMVWRFYPGYIEYALPDAMAVYGGARHSVGVVASSPLTIYTVVAMGFAAFVALAQSPGARGALEGPVWILLAAAAGFFAAFMAQSKLAMNQAYIAWAPALLALGWLWAQRTNMFDGPAARFARLFAAPVICAAFLISGGHFNLGLGADDQALARALRAAAPAGARIAAITEDMDLNFPLVRQVGGKWVGRQNSLWRVNCAGRLLERGVTEPTASLARAMINRDMQELVDDIAKGAPDVVLAQSSRLRELVAKRTGASHFLDDYERVAQVEETEVWRRKENVMGGRKTALSVEAE